MSPSVFLGLGFYYHISPPARLFFFKYSCTNEGQPNVQSTLASCRGIGFHSFLCSTVPMLKKNCQKIRNTRANCWSCGTVPSEKWEARLRVEGARMRRGLLEKGPITWPFEEMQKSRGRLAKLRTFLLTLPATIEATKENPFTMIFLPGCHCAGLRESHVTSFITWASDATESWLDVRQGGSAQNHRIPRKQEKEIIRYALVRRSKFGQSVSCYRAYICKSAGLNDEEP